MHHVVPALGNIKLEDLSPAHLNRLYARLLNEGRVAGGGLSCRTVRYNHAIIHRCLRDAVRWGCVSRNVSDLADPPRFPVASTSTWSRTELAHFLKSVEADRLHPAWVLLATTGMRRGEVLGLRHQDIDLDAQVVRIRQTLITVSRQVLVSEPKTRKAARQIPLAPQAARALQAHLRNAFLEGRRTGLAFTANGAPVHPDRFSRRFVVLGKRAGLPRIRLHDLRHTFATLALSEGIHPKVVSEILGHANIAITLEIYSHALPSLQRDATARVADLLFGGGGLVAEQALGA